MRLDFFMTSFRKALVEIVRLERIRHQLSSVDEMEELSSEIQMFKQSSYTASIYYTMLNINNRFPLLFPLIAVALALKAVF